MIARLLSLANNAIDSLALARAVRRLSEERDALATQAEELEDRLAESEADLDRILSHEDVGRVAPKVEEPMLTPAEEADVIAGAPAQIAPHGQSEIEILRAAVVRAHERIDALEKKPVEATLAAMAAQIERLDAEMRHVLVTIARDPKVEGDDVEAEEDPRSGGSRRGAEEARATEEGRADAAPDRGERRGQDRGQDRAAPRDDGRGVGRAGGSTPRRRAEQPSRPTALLRPRSVKGYVVRWDKALGQTLYAIQGGTSTVRQENSTVFATIREAVVEAGDGFVTARIFAVAEDGTETPLPTYEEALAQLDAVRAALAVLQRPDTLSSKDMAAGEHATAVEACKVAVGLVDSPTHNLESDRLRGLILAFVEKARLKSTAEGWCNLTAEFQAFDALRRERDRADAPPAHDLTPSEVFLAKVLAAWEAWPGRAAGGSLGEEATEVHEGLYRAQMIAPGDFTTEGAALLARARKAGVL